MIETRQVMRVGALKPRAIDVRFLAATNRVLEDEVARGAFRQDLYYRLNGISLVIPPLRARVDEIVPLARSFLETAAKRDGRPVPTLSPPALKLLEAYPWPGNIRELRNTMERALLLATGDAITPEELPLEKMRGAPAVPGACRGRRPRRRSGSSRPCPTSSATTTSGSSTAWPGATATRPAPPSCSACRGGPSARGSRPTTSRAPGPRTGLRTGLERADGPRRLGGGAVHRASSIILSIARAAPSRTSSGTVMRCSAGSSRSVR